MHEQNQLKLNMMCAYTQTIELSFVRLCYAPPPRKLRRMIQTCTLNNEHVLWSQNDCVVYLHYRPRHDGTYHFVRFRAVSNGWLGDKEG